MGEPTIFFSPQTIIFLENDKFYQSKRSKNTIYVPKTAKKYYNPCGRLAVE